jgi:hypothetical protein
MNKRNIYIITLISLYLITISNSSYLQDTENDFRGFLGKLSNDTLKKVNEIKNIWVTSFITNKEFPPIGRMYYKTNKEYIDDIMQYINDHKHKFPTVESFKLLVLKWSKYHDNQYIKEHVKPIYLGFN